MYNKIKIPSLETCLLVSREMYVILSLLYYSLFLQAYPIFDFNFRQEWTASVVAVDMFELPVTWFHFLHHGTPVRAFPGSILQCFQLFILAFWHLRFFCYKSVLYLYCNMLKTFNSSITSVKSLQDLFGTVLYSLSTIFSFNTCLVCSCLLNETLHSRFCQFINTVTWRQRW